MAPAGPAQEMVHHGTMIIGMLMLVMDGQPESLATFVEAYSVKEFDGRADDCAATTRPRSSRSEVHP